MAAHQDQNRDQDPNQAQSQAQAQRTDLIERALQVNADADAALELLRLPAAQLEPLLAERTPTEALTLKGWLCVLRGDYAEAISQFDQAHQAERKRTRKRNLYLPGLPGALYLLALLQRGEPDDLAKVHQQVRTCLRASVTDKLEAAFRVIGELAQVLAGQSKPVDCYALQHGFGYGAHRPLALLFRALALHWLGEPIHADIQRALAGYAEQYAQQTAKQGTQSDRQPGTQLGTQPGTQQRSQPGAKQSPQQGAKQNTEQGSGQGSSGQNAAPGIAQLAEQGSRWFLSETIALLNAIGYRDRLPAAPSTPPGLVNLTNLLKPKPHWTLALEALQRLAPDAAPSKDDPSAQDLRLVWLLVVQGSYANLEPREQKRTRGGGWTRGRAVALSRLANEPELMPHLSARDRAICACIVRERQQTPFGSSATQQSCSLNPDCALLAAVGHPLVLADPTDETPLELIPARPTLRVVKQGKDLLVRIEPFPQGKRGVQPVQESAYRFRLVQFDSSHQQIGAILGPDGLVVPKASKKELLKTLSSVAPLLTVHSDIGGGDSSAAEEVPADARPHLHLTPTGQGLDLGLQLELFVHPFGDAGPQLHPGEGSATLLTDLNGRAVSCTRDLRAEREAVQQLITACPALADGASTNWQLDDPEAALTALEQLQALGDAVLLDWPKGKRISLSAAVQVGQLRTSVNQKQDWLELGGSLHLDDGRVLELRELLAQAAEARGRFVRLGEREILSLSDALRRRLDGLRGLTDRGRFHPLAAPAIAELLDGMEIASSPAWEQLLARLNEVRELEPVIPSTLQAELRDYQAEGYRWLARLAHWGAGACLADDMGLGKTVQALALILSRAPEGPTLVLAPTSVCGNWLVEATRFAPTLRPLRFGAGDRAAMLAQAGPFDLIIASYGLLQTEAEHLAEVRWQTIVADEAQAFKNALTKRSKAIMQLQGAFRIITTGTPIENHLGELWNLFRFINPGLLGSLESFNARFANPIEQHQDQGARQRLRQLLRPFILRRLKSEVLSELPPRTEITLSLELSDSEQALYEAVRRESIARLEDAEANANPGQQRMQLLAEIMRLRRTCCHPRLALPDSTVPSSKLDAFADIVDELIENRHKALVFSQFVDHLKLIREHLDRRGIRYQYLDGSTPEPKRRAAVTAFQSGDGELFLISLRAGGAGLNLTAADYVIHMDPWWNPAVEDQASDRAHRIGQQRPVTIYRLVAKGTIEERILQLHANKRSLADALLEGTDDSSRLSYAEMLALVQESGGE
ncbi:helicase SNF2 [Lamprobacter modestohalophilus]|uniref:Helicase SNF2 n=1 Tax=Lamprobacter modestohalophilus TaxID=1064514 RepID=A0A9X1B4X5_9GAMM|nr:DEAD/DEAH box helicase [Lamprobacter modestohalophilus]MBK1619935.1 helicase SNF2 [Lamprobacter modestohalophilus]